MSWLWLFVKSRHFAESPCVATPGAQGGPEKHRSPHGIYVHVLFIHLEKMKSQQTRDEKCTLYSTAVDPRPKLSDRQEIERS